MNRPEVIAVCGIPGSGKSTLVTALAASVQGGRAISIDDYLLPSVTHADITQWVRDGAKFEDWQTPGLSDDLSVAIADPDVSYVILEEARGRYSPETAPLITHLVYLSVPPDVGLARKILQINENHSEVEAVQYYRHYLHCLPAVIRAIEMKIRPQADLILDGTESTTSLAQRVIDEFEIQEA
jgi:energy-coupling factor transporter ATP-binding protein EcfA2